MIFKKVLFLYFFQAFVIKMFINTPLKRVRVRDGQWGRETLQRQSPTTGECCLATGNRMGVGGGGAATGRKERLWEEDGLGRKNAIMEHLVGLVQKRWDRAGAAAPGAGESQRSLSHWQRSQMAVTGRAGFDTNLSSPCSQSSLAC